MLNIQLTVYLDWFHEIGVKLMSNAAPFSNLLVHHADSGQAFVRHKLPHYLHKTTECQSGLELQRKDVTHLYNIEHGSKLYMSSRCPTIESSGADAPQSRRWQMESRGCDRRAA